MGGLEPGGFDRHAVRATEPVEIAALALELVAIYPPFAVGPGHLEPRGGPRRSGFQDPTRELHLGSRGHCSVSVRH